MKKVIFIFLILISCLCLAVVSCADKEESSTSSSSTDNTTTISIVDGSAEGYMKIGNILMVWGATVANSNVSYPINFSETPSVNATCHRNTSSYVTVTSSKVITGCDGSYIALGKWQ